MDRDPLLTNTLYLKLNSEDASKLNSVIKGEVHTWGVFSGQIVLAVVSRNPLVKKKLVYF